MCMNEWASVIDIQRPLQIGLLYWGFDNCYHWWLWSLAPFGIFRAMLKLETPKINHLCREEMKKNIEAGYLSLKTRLATFTCLSLGVSCVFNGERRNIKHSLFLRLFFRENCRHVIYARTTTNFVLDFAEFRQLTAAHRCYWKKLSTIGNWRISGRLSRFSLTRWCSDVSYRPSNNWDINLGFSPRRSGW